MSQDAKQFLREELAKIAPVSPDMATGGESIPNATIDEQRWLEYIALASRLAALGDEEPLERWPSLARPFADRVETLLTERAQEGMWDLSQSLGRDLALAIIDAQDFHCFLRRQASILPISSRRMLTAWAETAEEVALDEDAARALQKFLRRFPLPVKERLIVVDVPRPFFETAVIAAAAQPCPMIECPWPSLAASEPSLAEIGQLDAGTPSDRLKRVFERLDVPVDMPIIGKLTISRRLNDQWQVVIDVRGDDDAPPRVDTVRLGRLPGQPVRNVSGRWLLDLRPWAHLQRVRWLEKPLVIAFENGHRLKMQ